MRNDICIKCRKFINKILKRDIAILISMYDVPEERLNKEMCDADSYFHIVNIN